jgi:hypothetical protein
VPERWSQGVSEGSPEDEEELTNDSRVIEIWMEAAEKW